MLFQVTHVHTTETCPGVKPDLLASTSKWWAALKANPDVKVLAGYVSPSDHTFHITLEASDNGALARALGPLNVLGQGTVHPVITLDAAIPLGEAGAFRMPGN